MVLELKRKHVENLVQLSEWCNCVFGVQNIV